MTDEVHTEKKRAKRKWKVTTRHEDEFFKIKQETKGSKRETAAQAPAFTVIRYLTVHEHLQLF